MKNIITTILLILLVFLFIYTWLLSISKQMELDCINNLSIDEDISVCSGE